MGLIRRTVAGRLDELADPRARRALVVLFRQLAVLDFQALHASPGWRTYLALHATFPSLNDDALTAPDPSMQPPGEATARSE
jgi:hypothetical protein